MSKTFQSIRAISQRIVMITKIIIFRIFKKETDSEIEVRKKLVFGVEYVCGADVEGDIAEFGTYTGRTASVLARAISRFDTAGKKIHLFDSFIGLPEAESVVDLESPHVRAGIWGYGKCKHLSKSKLFRKIRKLLPENRIIIYDGWFKDTLFQISKDTKYSLIHIDCDLYQSTIEVMDYLFQNQIIQEGAAIFFDDYNCNRALPHFGERRAWKEIIEKYSVVFTDGGEYGWAGRKFILHSYNKYSR